VDGLQVSGSGRGSTVGRLRYVSTQTSSERTSSRVSDGRTRVSRVMKDIRRENERHIQRVDGW
jgi:hypothetical protein